MVPAPVGQHFYRGIRDMHKTPGIDASTGSLGQGMSVSVGYALAGKRQEKPFRVFCVVGDGEAQEGVGLGSRYGGCALPPEQPDGADGL